MNNKISYNLESQSTFLTDPTGNLSSRRKEKEDKILTFNPNINIINTSCNKDEDNLPKITNYRRGAYSHITQPKMNLFTQFQLNNQLNQLNINKNNQINTNDSDSPIFKKASFFSTTYFSPHVKRKTVVPSMKKICLKKKFKKKVTFIDKDGTIPLLDIVPVESYKEYNIQVYYGDFNDNYKKITSLQKQNTVCESCSCVVY